MDLYDGLRQFQNDSDLWHLTLELESKAQEIVTTIGLQRDNPTLASLTAVRELLLKIERWKGMCLGDRQGNAQRNTARAIWDALHSSVTASDDTSALQAVMALVGFGASIDIETGQRRAKAATAVLRFLNPQEWGVVDWRTAAILGLLQKHGHVVDRSLSAARGYRANDLREVYDIIDDHAAISCVQSYRTLRTTRLPRAADIDMALFGLSHLAWPMRTPKSSSHARSM